MLTVQPKKRIVTRMLRLGSGEIARGYFLVAEFEGQIFAKLIRVEKLNNGIKQNDKTIYLPTVQPKKTIYASRFRLNDYASPYFSSTDTFFTSQMTRAPSNTWSV